ncbi:hypothetical protein [Burkholderia cepacia]|uniref:hypothetical protein n=1 Tax=Burkholderia cepacia TaxID=292 RepID=UPI001CF469A8|nr:hypothetical protein [Burkholderia cepacia]MCA8326180.1 hypothetical protein [Burkholderia cepacia]
MNQPNFYAGLGIGQASTASIQSIEQHQKQMAASAQIAPPDTVRSLAERAHQAMEVLDLDLACLAERLQPVREPTPCDTGEASPQTPAYPEAIAMLRALVDRIESRAAAVRQVSAELRI